MKRPHLVFVLSLVVPGAGLCYLGKWGWGILNFVAVLGLCLILAATLTATAFDSSIHYVWVACAAASAGTAHAVSLRVDQRTRPQKRTSG